ncbi:MAG: hypothetical protein ACLFTK_10120 [Anaerolineales bacterium]
MSFVQIDEVQQGLTRSQTLNSIVILLAVVMFMGYGLIQRNSAQGATQFFEDDQSGIRAQLPANWLITTETDAFVVQAEDPGGVPFKTLLRITQVPVGAEATLRNVIDTLTLQRAGRLSTYRVLSIQPTSLGEDDALEMTYAYVQSEPNPFLNAVPVVVQGRDVVIIRGGQALVLTYREEQSRFDENEFLFDNFLDTLEF